MLHDDQEQGKPGDSTPTATDRELHAQRLLIESIRNDIKQLKQTDERLIHSNDELRAASGRHDRIDGELLQRVNAIEIAIDRKSGGGNAKP